MSDPEGITVEQAILDGIRDGDPERPDQMFKVAHRHFTRYRRVGFMPDLDIAISMATEAIRLTPEYSRQRTPRLINLSVYWHEKYPRSDSQNVEGLEHSIEASRNAIAAISDTYPHRGTLLDQLSTKLGLLFMQTRDLSIIEENIKVQREAVNVTPASNPKRVLFLANLAAPLTARHQVLGHKDDLDEAIQICREVVTHTDEGSPQILERLGNLSLGLSERYDTQGNIKDLEEAIDVVKQAIDVTEEGSLERMAQLNNYANFVGDRYLRIGNMADLEDSIRTFQEVCDRVENDEEYLDRHKCFSNFGIQLSRRYRRIGTVADLKKAIQVCRKACQITPNDDTQAKHFSNLAIILKHEYFRTDDPQDLEEAICMQRETVRTVHKNHYDAVATLHNLAALLTTKYKITDKLEHLEEALQLGQQTVDLAPKGHPNRAAYLNTLAVQLSDMSRKTGSDNHMYEAISCGSEALEKTEDGHPERANRLVNQGGRYGNLYWKTKEREHLNCAITHLESALYSPSAYDIPRIRAGKEIIQYYAAVPDWDKAHDAVKRAMELVPRLISQTTNNADKQDILVQVYGLSSDAAAVALSANKGAYAALRFLEQGRGMLASSLEETWVETLHLKTEHPALAERLEQLRGRLESLRLAVDSTDVPNSKPGPISSARQVERKSGVEDLDELLGEIRQKPGFEDFLAAPNSHTSSPKVLEWLWDTTAEPVLEALGIRELTSQERLPRIWWIPTGVLSIYPLHAAGRHCEGSTETVIDRAMSSYSSSIKAIIRGRSRAGLDAVPSGVERAVLVSMRRTPGYSSLPWAGKETKLLVPVCKSKGFDVVEPKPLKADIASQLPGCKVFHFAGHGSTNLRDPSQSSLMLEDWQKDPLTVSTLLDINIQQYSPFLAYLSACGTGQIAHEKFLDESIHLISAFQLAGFRHVIGTLWEVSDDISVDMARITYMAIQRGDLADESVCRGLRKATLQLRDQWLQKQKGTSSRKRKAKSISEGETEMSEGTRDVVAMNDEENVSKLPLWVPYVHFGV
ncbi:30S ribosomal S17P protein [Fusarium beomiforme]|uniref:30S ribosomal S17P protein n=1 Tax=Fusarium beomiforme TaxID=44412 RepID=A0A9P5AG11_9HYPO|nr:30S ribosomal S17P protein [Fusarium beomiforme]